MTTMISVLFVSQELQEWQLDAIRQGGMGVQAVASFGAAIDVLNTREFAVAFVDIDLEGQSSSYLLDHLANSCPAVHVVAVVGQGGPTRHRSLASTAATVVKKPFSRPMLLALAEQIAESSDQFPRTKGQSLIGISSGIRKIRRSVDALKEWVQPILISGETGVGKEVVAHALHQANKQRQGPLMTVDCGAINPSLLENELFGHAKGAYTGAFTSEKGLLLAATGGTLFFDEVGELPLESQTRLLRVLQEREIRPVGGTSLVPIDVRICAATNVDLEAAVRQKRFREDLFYRLSAITIKVPPLRDRREDIPLIADRVLRSNQIRQRLSIDAHLRMMEYGWPGNVRELQNHLVRAGALADGPVLRGSDIVAQGASNGFMPERRQGRLRDMEREEILRTVTETDNDIMEAAKRLGIGKTTLYRKLKAYRMMTTF